MIQIIFYKTSTKIKTSLVEITAIRAVKRAICWKNRARNQTLQPSEQSVAYHPKANHSNDSREHPQFSSDLRTRSASTSPSSPISIFPYLRMRLDLSAPRLQSSIPSFEERYSFESSSPLLLALDPTLYPSNSPPQPIEFPEIIDLTEE